MPNPEWVKNAYDITDDEIMQNINLDIDTEMEDREGEENPLRCRLNHSCLSLPNSFGKKLSLKKFHINIV